jgi:CRP-like cAMP-binding protein
MSAKTSLENLFSVLSAIRPLSERFKKALAKEMVHLSLPANFNLLEAPRISDHAYFLDSGLAMSYRFIKGDKQIETFWASGQIILSAKSFFEQVASNEFIVLLAKSEVLCISYKSVIRLLDAFPEANFIYRVVMNQYYEQTIERLHDMQHLSSLERYEKLMASLPSLEQSISQEHIASYLGIAPQSLSRLKRQKDGFNTC